MQTDIQQMKFGYLEQAISDSNSIIEKMKFGYLEQAISDTNSIIELTYYRGFSEQVVCDSHRLLQLQDLIKLRLSQLS